MSKRNQLAGKPGLVAAAAAGVAVLEAPTEEIRRALDSALRSTYGAKETYVWTRDFDPAESTVYFDICDSAESKTWQQSYTIGPDRTAKLTGVKIETVVRTVYDSATGKGTARIGESRVIPVQRGPLVAVFTSEAVKRQPKGTMRVHYIRAGWSLNGRNYPEDLLKTEGVSAAVPGTLLYVDHATTREDQERPSGTVTRLAAVQVGAAWWDEEAKAVAANVRLFEGPWKESLIDMADTIGLSVRAWITTEPGEVDGQAGDIVRSIEGYKSVDFVTVPAAGGAIISVYESVGEPADEARNVGSWLESRIHSDFTRQADYLYGEGYLTRAERIALSGAVGSGLEAFAAHIEANAPHLYTRDPYKGPDSTTTQTQETATGSRAETVTEEAPTMTQAIPAGTGNSGAAPNNDPTVTAEARATVAEAENARLTGALTTASEANRREAIAEARAVAAEAETRRLRGNEAARDEVAAQFDALTGVPAGVVGLIRPRVESAIRNAVPFVAEGDQVGQVDTAGLTAAVASAILAERTYLARALEASGVGVPNGVTGVDPGKGGLTAEATGSQLTGILGEMGMPKDAAEAAGKAW